MNDELKPCEYCHADLPAGTNKKTRQQRSAHFATCAARLAQPSPISFARIIEYLVVGDKDSKILKSTTDYHEAKRLANLIRRGGGEVTIFKSTEA